MLVMMGKLSPQVLQVGKTAPSPSSQLVCNVLSQVHHVGVLQELHVLEQATLLPLCKMLRVERGKHTMTKQGTCLNTFSSIMNVTNSNNG